MVQLSLTQRGILEFVKIFFKMTIPTIVGYCTMIGLIIAYYPFPNWIVMNGLFFCTALGLALGFAWAFQSWRKYYSIRKEKILEDEARLKEKYGGIAQ